MAEIARDIREGRFPQRKEVAAPGASRETDTAAEPVSPDPAGGSHKPEIKTPSAPDDRDREQVKAALNECAGTTFWRSYPQTTEVVVKRMTALLAEARAEGRAERLSATEEVLAKSRDLARFLELEKARREMEGTVNERTYEPDRDGVAYIETELRTEAGK